MDIARLEAAGFSHITSQNPKFHLVHRGEILCLIEVAANKPGSPMMMTPRGPAALIWRDGDALLSGHGFEDPATAQQVEALRSFSHDLATALA